MQVPGDSDWNMDSDATAHISFKAGILSFPSPISSDFTSILVGNGASIPITHFLPYAPHFSYIIFLPHHIISKTLFPSENLLLTISVLWTLTFWHVCEGSMNQECDPPLLIDL